MYTIYKHTNLNTGKSYIGYTILTMEERWQQHLELANMGGVRRDRTSIKLWNAIRKYGNDSWEHQILTQVSDELLAKQEEIFQIERHDTFVNGYNTTKGGDGFKGNHDQSTKKKIGIASRMNAARMRELGVRRKRQPHSEETKEKMRLAARRRTTI